MGENVPSLYGSTNSTSEHNPAYYSDIARCVVPSCGKWRRDNPGLQFFVIPQNLKETWCKALRRNCPKRKLYVCRAHINTEQDCYKTKSGKLRLKSTANLIPTSENKDQQTKSLCFTEEHLSILPVQREDCRTKSDVAVQVEQKLKHQGVTAKPSTKTFGQTVNFSHIPKKRMSTQPQEMDLLSSTTTSNTSTPSMYEPSSSTGSSVCFDENHSKYITGQKHILKRIEEDPKMFIGLPKKFYWFLDYLAHECAISKLHIIITLFKIRQDDTMLRISRHFDLDKSTVLNIFKQTLPVLTTYIQNFIYLPKKIKIKKNLPPVFKPRYSNIQCIIDCFEIEIQKPSDPLKQAQTWSQYKNCNTLKYLIACCPNGFVCFVSKGFGGRISDKAITESSGFVDILPSNTEILADRGFKGIEAALNAKNIKLVRPPSVSSTDKPTKAEVVISKIIASLRVHIERVIRRVREFAFLKTHAVVKNKQIYYIDEYVVVACALINMQGDIIKSI